MLAAQKATVHYPETDGKPMAETDTHRNLLLSMVEFLQSAFPESYVSGNICLYYEEGDPRKMISPDAMLCRSQPKSEKRIYHAWEEDGQLDLVMEFSSASTKRVDHHKKKQIYSELLQVPYYLIFDPHALYLHFFEWTPQGYQQVEANARGHWEMPLLDIEVGLELPNSLRLFTSKGIPILNFREKETQRANQAEAKNEVLREEMQYVEAEAQRAEEKAQKAEAEAQRAKKEAQRSKAEAQKAEEKAQKAEAENQALREELEKLRSRNH